MTPVVFVIAGLIFAATAASYAEATTMYPEAGGSSSFARRAFNEFWSFFAAWGQMLTYIITVSISAFFVPHYLAVFWAPLGESPGDIIGGIVVVVVLGLVNIRGAKESTGVNVVLRGGGLRHPGAAGDRRAGPGVLAARPGGQREPGHHAHVEEPVRGHPRGDAGLHRHRDRVQPGRGGQGLRKDDPQGDRRRGDRRGRDLRLPSRRGPVGDAGAPRRDGAGPAQGAGRLRRRPDPRRGQEHRSGLPPARGRDLRGHAGRAPSCSSPRTRG